jgi:DNA-binding ferritin-like protein
MAKTRKNTKKSNKNVYQSIVSCFMDMLNTVKLYHWKTTSYSTHKATDQLYTELNGKIDEFVEVMLGKPELRYSRNMILDVRTIRINKYKTNNDFKKEVEYYKHFMMNLTEKKEFKKDSVNADLLAIRDEILALFNQFLYLLSLEH